MKEIPVLHAKGKSLAEAYENALVELYNNGGRTSTQYDKPGDPQSIDATMNITIEEPLSDPMIHKAFPGGISDLREYVYELEGRKDGWVKCIDDKNDTRWEYTYHGRLAHWGSHKIKKHSGARGSVPNYLGNDGFAVGDNVDQIKIVIDKLIKQPYTRQAQMITWHPVLDNDCYDPACLQSLWFRITEEDGIKHLNTNIRFRSNDAWGAYFMNSFGFTMFIKEKILDEIQNKTGWKLKMGRINWQADSWHIYGKDIQQAKERLFDRISNTKFEDRVYNFYDPDIQEMYKEGEPDILKKIQMKTKEFEGK